MRRVPSDFDGNIYQAIIIRVYLSVVNACINSCAGDTEKKMFVVSAEYSFKCVLYFWYGKPFTEHNLWVRKRTDDAIPDVFFFFINSSKIRYRTELQHFRLKRNKEKMHFDRLSPNSCLLWQCDPTMGNHIAESSCIPSQLPKPVSKVLYEYN